MQEIKYKIISYIKQINYIKLIIPGLIILNICFSFLLLFQNTKQEERLNKKQEVKIETIEEKEEVEKQEIFPIYVDVKGSVSKPGVYMLDSGSRVIDAIKKAGNVTKDANTRFINMSQILNDSDVVIVYSNKEIEEANKKETIVNTPCVCEEVKNDSCYIEKEEDKEEAKEESNTNSKVNINTASLEELKTLDGIGDAKATAIIEYRSKYGNFKSIEELLEVDGISDTIFTKIKENITIW